MKPVPITRPTDFIELETEAFTSPLPKYRIRPPSEGEELLLLGYYKYSSTVNSQQNEVLRYGKSGPCRATISNNGCIYYGCQTHQGFSGAPLIHLGQNTIDIIGIHLSTVKDQKDCPTSMTDSKGNLGYILNIKQEIM
jgi:hypothetical protein